MNNYLSEQATIKRALSTHLTLLVNELNRATTLKRKWLRDEIRAIDKIMERRE